MAGECLIDVEIGESLPIDVTIEPAASITVDIGSSNAVDVSVASASAVDVSVASADSITVTVSDDAINVTVGESNAIAVTVMEAIDLDEFLQTVEEFAARPRTAARRLAAYTTTIAVHTTAPAQVELPTALVVYPTFRDAGYIELTCGAAHANVGPNTVSFYLYGGVAGATALLATFTSEAFAVGAGAFQFEFSLRVKSQGPSAQNLIGRMVYNEPGGGPPITKEFIGRLTTLNFGDPLNGDGGDVEFHLEASVSGTGTTFNVRNFTVMQYAERSGQ